MFTRLLSTLSLIAILFVSDSCRKDSDSSQTGDGSWTVYRTGNFEYNLTVESINRQEIDGFKVLTAVSTEDTLAPKSISIWFRNWPSLSGNYQPVEFLSNRQLDNNEVGISLAFPGTDTLYSTGLKYVGFAPDIADPVKITFRNGKLTIDIPMMSSYTDTPLYLDSASFKGLLAE